MCKISSWLRGLVVTISLLIYSQSVQVTQINYAVTD